MDCGCIILGMVEGVKKMVEMKRPVEASVQ